MKVTVWVYQVEGFLRDTDVFATQKEALDAMMNDIAKSYGKMLTSAEMRKIKEDVEIDGYTTVGDTYYDIKSYTLETKEN